MKTEGTRMTMARWSAHLSLGLAPLLLLAACSSQAPPRFHSLMTPASSVRVASSPAITAWQLLPVSIPAQVDQPQFVVRRADETLAVLEQERWIAPLTDEIRAALVEQMAATLGSPGTPPAPGRKDWRIAVDVQRFDSTLGRSSLVAQWLLLAAGDAPVLRCRSVIEQSVGAGIPALAGGHRQALQQLGSAIALALVALDAGAATGCPATNR